MILQILMIAPLLFLVYLIIRHNNLKRVQASGKREVSASAFPYLSRCRHIRTETFKRVKPGGGRAWVQVIRFLDKDGEKKKHTIFHVSM